MRQVRQIVGGGAGPLLEVVGVRDDGVVPWLAPVRLREIARCRSGEWILRGGAQRERVRRSLHAEALDVSGDSWIVERVDVDVLVVGVGSQHTAGREDALDVADVAGRIARGANADVDVDEPGGEDGKKILIAAIVGCPVDVKPLPDATSPRI